MAAPAVTLLPRHLEAALRSYGWPLSVEQALADRFKRPLLQARAKAMAHVEARMAAGQIRQAAPAAVVVPLPWRRSGGFDARRAAANDPEDRDEA